MFFGLPSMEGDFSLLPYLCQFKPTTVTCLRLAGGSIASAKEIADSLGIKREELQILHDELPDPRAAAPRNEKEAAETVLQRWSIDPIILTSLIDENPSLRGMLFGYVAEFKFSQIWLTHKEVSYAVKPDDHNRKRKGDRVILYKGGEFSIEIKSLQTSMIQRMPNGGFFGKAQCDGSDRRIVRFKDGTELNTTCLLCGEFDMLAINCFAFQALRESR